MKTSLGKINYEGEKTYFVLNDNKEYEPVTLNEYQMQQIKKYPDSQVICKTVNKGNQTSSYIQIHKSTSKIEDMVYTLCIDKEKNKGYIKAFSAPSLEIDENHIKQSVYNKIQIGLFVQSKENGKILKIRNASMTVSRYENEKYLSAEEYLDKINQEVGNKIEKLTEAGINVDNLKVYFSNINYIKFSKQIFQRLYEGLLSSYNQQIKTSSSFSYGYISYDQDKEGNLWANNNPVSIIGDRGKNPMFTIGEFPTEDEKQEYQIDKIEQILNPKKEKKQEVSFESELEEDNSCTSYAFA